MKKKKRGKEKEFGRRGALIKGQEVDTWALILFEVHE